MAAWWPTLTARFAIIWQADTRIPTLSDCAFMVCSVTLRSGGTVVVEVRVIVS